VEFPDRFTLRPVYFTRLITPTLRPVAEAVEQL
jgi:hypothetical protein